MLGLYVLNVNAIALTLTYKLNTQKWIKGINNKDRIKIISLNFFLFNAFLLIIFILSNVESLESTDPNCQVHIGILLDRIVVE